ncbi:MAG TPA: SGNH/GDSL hydrolase family protein [Terriglobales bacterium]|nr:SGNH/GDSL hydrolase family protein [Terriglobales bacterium]
MMRLTALLLLFLPFSVFAQQTPSPGSAEQHLEWWKESRANVYLNDFGELKRYRDANAALAAPNPDENRVVFYGDSITDGWRIAESFPGKPYINRGISGQTTSQMLVRLRQDVIDLHPKVVVILAGTNDIAGNTGPISLEGIEENIASITELARAHNIAVVWSSVTPVNNYTPRSQDFFATRSPAKILELNRWLKQYCADNHLVYLDYFPPMVDKDGLLRRDLAEDGLHPNAAGYAIMAPLAEAAIQKALAAH